VSPAVAARPTGAAGRIERRGVIASVTLPGADEVLADRLPAPGSMAPAETLQLVWHGRRRVPGVMPGEWLTVRGRVTQMDGVPTLHNPEFDLVDAPEATR